MPQAHWQGTKRPRPTAQMRRAAFAAAAAALCLGLGVGCGGQGDGTSAGDPFEHALTFATGQLTRSSASLPATQHPRNTLPDGRWSTAGAGDWTSGFYPGCLWLTYERTKDDSWAAKARQQTADLQAQQNNTGDHDVGFRLMCSYGNGYRLTQDSAYRSVILAGARSLATRYNPVVGCTRSWSTGSWRFPVIIDNMMNLELLLWAAANGGERAWYDMAVSHAERTMTNHVRADGSTYHVVDYDPVTGAVIARVTHQGFGNESTWARGQAWGIYGFTMVYRYTGDRRFLDTAARLADYALAHLPADFVPYWDFSAPQAPPEPRDSSAAAIMASGLLELGDRVGSDGEKKRYHDAGVGILRSLCGGAYLAEGSPSAGILLHATGNKPGGSEIDVSLIYGDYYFLEALMRYQRGSP